MANGAVEILINARDNASKQFDSARAGLDKLTQGVFTLKGALAGLAAGVSIGVVVSQLRAAGNEMDAIAKHADKLGMATEELVGLQYAAEQSGVSAGNLDLAVQRMTRRISEAAATGGGPAKAALDELGLSAQRLARMTPEQQMHALADAMQGVKSQSDRVRLAFKLFDSGGVGLVNTLANGSQGLREMRAEAEQLGLTFSRMDAARVEAANDALARASKIMEGVKRHLVVELAPIVEMLATAIKDVAVEWFDFDRTVEGTESKMSTMHGLLKGMLDFAQGIHRAFLQAQLGMTEIIAGMVKAAAMFESDNAFKRGAARTIPIIGSMLGAADALGIDPRIWAEELDREINQIHLKLQRAESAPRWSERLQHARDAMRQQPGGGRFADAITAAHQGATDWLTQQATNVSNLWKTAQEHADGLRKTAEELAKQAQRNFESMKREAAAIVQANLTQEERLQQGQARAQWLHDMGLLSDEMLARERDRLQKAFDDATRREVRDPQQIDPAVSTSRFLTRVPGAADPQLAISKNTEETAKGIKALRALVIGVQEAIRENKIIVRQLGIRG